MIGGTGLTAPAGSPPQARGRRLGVTATRAGPRPGLTPAGAGTACSCCAFLGVWRAHPRRRGDGFLRTSDLTPMLGSPPQARGRRKSSDAVGRFHGLTPAGAGTAHHRMASTRGPRAHPRRRGDGDPDLCGGRPGAGSPPQARGRLAVHRIDALVEGLTPAGAGTAVMRSFVVGAGRAHPRRRGDGPVSGSTGCMRVSSGSPPQARGRPRSALATSTATRAHPRRRGDGGRASWTVTKIQPGAHPRRRGDGWYNTLTRVFPAGSPPQARGRRHGCPVQDRRHGLTPAGAGTAARSRPRPLRAGAHPRRRGDGIVERS